MQLIKFKLFLGTEQEEELVELEELVEEEVLVELVEQMEELVEENLIFRAAPQALVGRRWLVFWDLFLKPKKRGN